MDITAKLYSLTDTSGRMPFRGLVCQSCADQYQAAYEYYGLSLRMSVFAVTIPPGHEHIVSATAHVVDGAPLNLPHVLAIARSNGLMYLDNMSFEDVRERIVCIFQGAKLRRAARRAILNRAIRHGIRLAELWRYYHS
jgi:hypothetical protein